MSMAWAVFTFSKEGRARLAGLLRALLITQLVVSLCMVILCYNTSLKVMMLLKKIHKVTVFLLYGLIFLQAYCMKLHYTGGLRLVTLLLKSPHWKRTLRVTRVWLAGGCMLAANGLLVYAACRSTLKTLLKELSSSLRMGISQYLVETTWKTLMDTMQVELNCCGAENPSDWHEIPWLNMDFFNESSDVVMRLAGSDGKILPPVTPYSCCSPSVRTPCLHDPFQQWVSDNSKWNAWPLAPVSLHARGCVEAIKSPLTSTLLTLHCFTLLVLLLQVMIVVLAQLMRTSAHDAVLRGDCEGEGRGALFGTLTPLEVFAESPRISYCEMSEPSVCALTLHRRKRRLKGARPRYSYPYLS